MVLGHSESCMLSFIKIWLRLRGQCFQYLLRMIHTNRVKDALFQYICCVCSILIGLWKKVHTWTYNTLGHNFTNPTIMPLTVHLDNCCLLKIAQCNDIKKVVIFLTTSKSMHRQVFLWNMMAIEFNHKQFWLGWKCCYR